jgi:transposase
VRGFAKSLGMRLPAGSSETFPRRIRGLTTGPLFDGCEPLLRQIEGLTQEIRHLDREIEHLCRERYPETAALRQVPGVGALTALCFVLTLENPARFPKSRSVGAFLGLRSRQRESGESKPRLRITKAGDRLLRTLLIQCGHYILGPFGPDTDLRRWGLALAARGGRAAKKRAAGAVARRLAVLLHRLWITRQPYVPRREASSPLAA